MFKRYFCCFCLVLNYINLFTYSLNLFSLSPELLYQKLFSDISAPL